MTIAHHECGKLCCSSTGIPAAGSGRRQTDFPVGDRSVCALKGRNRDIAIAVHQAAYKVFNFTKGNEWIIESP